MEQNHSLSQDNPFNIRPLEDQARLPYSIAANYHQNLPHPNYFLNANERNYNPYFSALPIQSLEDEMLRLRLSSPAAPNIHGQSSSTMGIRVGYRAVGASNDHGYRHGYRIGRMDNELDFSELLRLYEGGNLSETQIIRIIMDRIHEIVIDRDGNSFIQSLLGLCSENFINHLIHNLITKDDLFLVVCLHNLGHRVLAKLMDHMRQSYQQSLIASTISCHAISLAIAKGARGGHEVLKCCFQNLPRRHNELILLRIAKGCLELARDQAGCCMLQVCIEYAIDEVREALIFPLIQDAESLSMHAYGNYVIQFMIKLDGANIGPRIIKELKNHFVELSMNKYASNVVEKCVSCCEGYYADEIIFEIMKNGDTLRVCSNEYGNFVVQKVLSFAKGEAFDLLIAIIRRGWLSIQFHIYGKNVIAAVNRITKKSKSQES